MAEIPAWAKPINAPVSAVPEWAKPLQEVGQESKPPEEKPKTFISDALIPSFLDTVKEVAPTTRMKGSGFMDAAADVALGIPEAIGAAAGGLGQFIGGVVTGAPSMVEALPQTSKESFSPARGTRAALEAGERAMQPFAYEPKTGTANLLLSPITVGFGTLNKSLEKIIRGYHGPEADPKLVEDRVKGGQYVLNATILGLPMLKEAKTIKDIDPADIAKLDQVKEQVPELKDLKTEDVFDILRQESVASEMPSSTGSHPDIVAALTEIAKSSDRPSMYKNVINLINTYDGDFVADFNNPKVKQKGISDKRGSSIRKTIQEVLDGRKVEAETPKGVGEDVPLEQDIAPLNNETQQIPIQQTPVPEEGWLSKTPGEDVSKGVTLETGWIHNPEIVPFDKSRVESRKRVRKAGGPTQVELTQYPDVESASKDWEVGREITRAMALEESQFDIAGSKEEGYKLKPKSGKPIEAAFSAVQVGDKYYRVVKKPAEPMKSFEPPAPEVLPEGYADTFLDQFKDEEFTGQPGIKDVNSDPVFEGTRGPDKVVKTKKKSGLLTVEDLKAWREGHIAEINAKRNAPLNNETKQSTPKITPQDLPIISDRFKSYATEADARADGVKGKLLKDPETGRWMEEPRFEDDIPELFEDSEVDSPYYPERRVESIDDFDGELEYDGGRNLWDLMNNEVGAVRGIGPIGLVGEMGQIFYSKALRILDEKFLSDKHIKAEEIWKTLANNGTGKHEEAAASLPEFFKAHKDERVRPSAVRDWIKSQMVDVKEVELDNKLTPSNLTLQDLKTNLIPKYMKRMRVDRDTAIKNISELSDQEVRDLANVFDWNTESTIEFPTRYDEYAKEPGGVEGSYRETFLTAANLPDATAKEYFGISDANWEKLDAQDRSSYAQEMRQRGDGADANWRDGHSEYHEIKNPIVRVIYDKVKMPDGKEAVRVLEMQTPLMSKGWTHPDLSDPGGDYFFPSKEAILKYIHNPELRLSPEDIAAFDINEATFKSEGEFTKMPPYLQKNAYDMGVKWIVAKAKEEGISKVLVTKADRLVKKYDRTQDPAGIERLYDRDLVKKFEAYSGKASEVEPNIPDGKLGRVKYREFPIDSTTPEKFSIFGNQRGAVEIDPVAVKDGLKRIGSMITKAAEKGLEFPEYLDSLGITAASKEALLKFQQQVPEYEKYLRDNLKSSLTPDKSKSKKIVKDFTHGVTYAMDSSKGPVKQFRDWLKSNKRIVDDYVSGSEILPDGQVPMIEKTAPQIDLMQSALPANLRRLFRIKDAKDIPYNIGESPSIVLRRAFKFDNPVKDMQESHMAAIRNIPQHYQWAKDILKGVESGEELIQKELYPIYEKFSPVMERIGELNTDIGDLKRIKSGHIEKSFQRHTQRQIDAKNAELKEVMKSLEPMKSAWQNKIVELMGKSSDIKATMHASGLLSDKVVLTPEELKLSNHLQTYFKATAGRLEGVGIPVIKNRNYMPHIWKDVLKDGNMFSKRSKIPNSMRFMHQLPDSIIPIPSAHTILREYIPMVERKLAYQPFLSKWADFANGRRYPRLQSYMRKWVDKNLYREPASLVEKAVDKLVNFEYVRLIGLSLSVGRKHLMKLPQTWSHFNVKDTAKAMSAEAKVPIQMAMKKLGVKGDAAELDVITAFVRAKDLVQTLDNMPAMQEFASTSKGKFKQIMSQPVTAIEALDNGVSVLSSIIAGSKKGLTYEQIHKGIWDTINLSNFRGGADQPLWQKNSFSRAVGMFMSTPWKMLEYKTQLIERAMRGERDVFGTHYGAVLLRYAMITGSAIMMARLAGDDILTDFIHLPYVDTHKGGPYISPVIDLAYKTGRKGVFEGAKEHFGPGTWGTFSKFHKVNSETYPSKMYNSAIEDVLGMRRANYEWSMNSEKGLGKLEGLKGLDK